MIKSHSFSTKKKEAERIETDDENVLLHSCGFAVLLMCLLLFVLTMILKNSFFFASCSNFFSSFQHKYIQRSDMRGNSFPLRHYVFNYTQGCVRFG